jgi:hypothetical protein
MMKVIKTVVVSRMDSFIFFTTDDGMNVPAGKPGSTGFINVLFEGVSQPLFCSISVPDMNQLVVFHTKGD